MNPLLLSLALGLALPAGTIADEPALPAAAPLADGQSLPAMEQLLETAPPAPETISRDEPPILARPDARTLTYGADVPRARCIPYRVCTLLFAPDETILDVALGDSQRWELQLFSSGTAPTIVYKPTSFNLLTNLVVQTDRRLYTIELVAPTAPEGNPRAVDLAYDALVRFRYPHDWVRTAPAPTSPPTPPPAAPTVASPSDLHFDYAWKRPRWPSKRLPWTPDVTYDDGERTYIHLPPNARNDLPAVLLIDAAGQPSPTDTSLTGQDSDWLVVPAVAPKLELVRATRGATRRLTLIRRGS